MGSSPYKNSPKYLFYRPFTKRKKVVFDHLFSFSYEPQCDESRDNAKGIVALCEVGYALSSTVRCRTRWVQSPSGR